MLPGRTVTVSMAVAYRAVGKDEPLREASVGWLWALDCAGASCGLGAGKVTLLLSWGACPPRWCWSAL